MTIAIFFWTLLALCCAYGVSFGGRDARWIILFYVSAVLLTIPAQLMQWSWATINIPVAMVDIVLFIALYSVAMRSKNYWPIWFVAFHLITLTTHFAAVTAPTFQARVYFALATFWSIPKLLVLIIGVSFDRSDADAVAKRN